MAKAVTYVVIDGEEVELDEVSDEKLRELGLEHLRSHVILNNDGQ